MRVPVEVKTLSELRSFPLFQTVKTVFDKALANGDLIYKESENVEILKDAETGMKYEISITEGLSQRPNNRAIEPGHKDAVISEKVLETVIKRNPFLHPEPELTIIDSLLDKYRLILNKFPNKKYHFLMVTKEFEQQDSLLKPLELQLMHVILENLNKDDEDMKYFSFFNSGSESGYSQFHKHIQFMITSPKLDVYQEKVVSNVEFFIPKEIVAANRPLFFKNASFKHYILKLKESNGEDDEQDLDNLAILYMYLIKRVMNIYKEFEIDTKNKKISYNLMMMPDWIMIIPRKNAKFEDIWQNSLGFMGLFYLKNEELKKKVIEIGFSKILQECGFPMEEDEDKIVYNEYGY